MSHHRLVKPMGRHDMRISEVIWLRRIVNGLCVFCLVLFVPSELYSAAATALDHSGRFPAWESTLGIFLFVLPAELVVALILLLYRERPKLGFNLVLVNLVGYAGFLCLESLSVRTDPGTTKGDWVATGIWAMLAGVAVAAAHFLKSSRVA